MRAHYITDNPSGYRWRLFPLDNSASFSLSTLCLLSMLINTTLKTQRKKTQLWGCNSSNAALMGALSISLKCWQMKNKRWLLLAMLINNRPFEPGASHAPIVCLEDGGCRGHCDWQLGTPCQQWDEVTIYKPRMSTAPGTDRDSNGYGVLDRVVTWISPHLFSIAEMSARFYFRLGTFKCDRGRKQVDCHCWLLIGFD